MTVSQQLLFYWISNLYFSLIEPLLYFGWQHTYIKKLNFPAWLVPSEMIEVCENYSARTMPFCPSILSYLRFGIGGLVVKLSWPLFSKMVEQREGRSLGLWISMELPTNPGLLTSSYFMWERNKYLSCLSNFIFLLNTNYEIIWLKKVKYMVNNNFNKGKI